MDAPKLGVRPRSLIPRPIAPDLDAPPAPMLASRPRRRGAPVKIPYGLSYFSDIRGEGYFYVDKTPFLPRLESAESGYRYLIFLRPRRMDKSLLLSMLEHYYDLGRADQFDALFSGLWVHEHPTPERNAYLPR
jgi:hypothetical protein